MMKGLLKRGIKFWAAEVVMVMRIESLPNRLATQVNPTVKIEVNIS
jgi:hypothetical protein